MRADLRDRAGLGTLVIAALAAALAPVPSAPASVGGDRKADPTIAWEQPTQVATGKGTRGPWRQNDSDYDYVDHPAVAMDRGGNVAVAWVDQGRKDVLLQVYGADGAERLKQPTNVSRSPETFSWMPRVVFTGDDGSSIAVVWQEIIFSGGPHGGEIYSARSVDGGRTFTPPSRLSNIVAGHGKGRLDYHTWDNGSLDLVVGQRGALHAAWTDWEGRLFVSRSTDGGATFAPPVQVPGTGWDRPARGPSLAVRADGDLVVAWAVGEDPKAAIHVSTSRDGGFDPPKAVARTAGRADAPRIAVDAKDVLHLVFFDTAGSPEHTRVLHARTGPGNLDFFSAPVVVQGGEDAPEGAVFPDLAIGADGAIYVVSEVPRGGSVRQGLQLSISTDGGSTFSAPVLVPGSTSGPGANGGMQGRFTRRLAVNPAGELAVGISRFQMDVASGILVARGRVRYK